MTNETPPAHDWPDEEGGPSAQAGLRSDTGASLERPKEEDTDAADRGEPAGGRGPAGSGEVPGRGDLGTGTPGHRGTEQGPR